MPLGPAAYWLFTLGIVGTDTWSDPCCEADLVMATGATRLASENARGQPVGASWVMNCRLKFIANHLAVEIIWLRGRQPPSALPEAYR